jgi:PAS domain S-box-containing protein
MQASREELFRQNAELKARLQEAEEALQALRSGELDAIIVSGTDGDQVFSLAGAESVYRLFVETMREMALSLTLEGRILFSNGRLCDLLQIPAEHVLGRPLAEFVAADSQAALAALLRDSPAEPVKTRLVFQAGERRVPAHVSAALVKHPDSASLCLVAADLTELESTAHQLEELRRSQRALRESERFIKSVADSSPHCFFVFDFDTRSLTYTNRSILRDLGYPLEVQTLVKELDEFRAFMPPDEMPHLARLMEEWQGLPDGVIRDDEYRLRHADGTLRYFAGREVVFARRADGTVQRVLGSLLDITARKQAELELERVRSLMAEGQRIAHLGTFEYVAATQTTIWSEEEYRIYGLDPAGPSPVYDVMLAKCLPPEDAALLHKTFSAAMQSNSVYELEHRILRPDGSVRWVYDRAHPHLAPNGQLLRYVGATLDITARKEAETRLTADLAALTRMHELSGKLLGATGLQPLLQAVMDAAVAITGAQRGTLQLLEGDALRIVAHHGHQPAFLDFFASAENRASICGEATKRGERVVVPDVEASPLFAGTPSLVILREAGVRAVQSTPLLSRSGKLLGILTTQWAKPFRPDEHDLWRVDLLARQASDLIEQLHAQEALRQSERLYRGIGESLDYGIWICDPQGRNIYASESLLKLVGITLDQCKDFGWGSVLHPDDAAETMEAWKQCVQAGGPWYREHRYLGVDGQYHPILACGVAVRDDRGQITHWAGINLDISRLKKAEAAIQASLREKEVLLKEVHHRVKNNMQVLSSLVSLQTNGIGDSAARAVFNDFRDQVRAMALVHETLYQSENLARIDLAKYTTGLAVYLGRMHGREKPGLRLTPDLQPVTVPLESAVPCGLILNELITNAYKHAFADREAGEIVVHLRRDGDGAVTFGVRDNGVGLPAGLDWERTTSLGLRLVKMLTGQLKGRLDVTTDHGTAVRITFTPPRGHRNRGGNSCLRSRY